MLYAMIGLAEGLFLGFIFLLIDTMIGGNDE